MKELTANTNGQTLSRPCLQSGTKLYERFKFHLLWDVIPTVMILALVAGGTLTVTRSMSPVKSSPSVFLSVSK